MLRSVLVWWQVKYGLDNRIRSDMDRRTPCPHECLWALRPDSKARVDAALSRFLYDLDFMLLTERLQPRPMFNRKG